MRIVSEQEIRALAPNDGAFRNGKKLSESGAFVARRRSGDDSYYDGQCKGSGKSVYQVSAFFEDGKAPVIRCSCPSRQFPCKHGLGLLFEIAAGKPFEETVIPAEILEKQEKLRQREEKRNAQPAETATKGTPRKKSASGQAAFRKKLEKQLEGLTLLHETLQRRMKQGLLSNLVDTGEEDAQLTKRLGDSYLAGPQAQFRRFSLSLQAASREKQQTERERFLLQAVRQLEKLRTLVRRGSAYLEEQLAAKNSAPDKNPLYDALGGVRKKEELEALGLMVPGEAGVLQLAFEVDYDEAKREFLDLGYWISLSDGTIYREMNFRPLSAKKYIAEKDSSNEKLCAAQLPCYPAFPGEAARIRLEGAAAEPVTSADRQRVLQFALPIAEAGKQAAKALQSVLAAEQAPALLQLARLQEAEERIYAVDAAGGALRLAESKDSAAALQLLAQFDTEEAALFGCFVVDGGQRELQFMPKAVVTGQGLIRLTL